MLENIIVGGGASGVMTAISAKGNKDTLILEAGVKILKKLSQTGNGQGNLTNLNMSEKRFFGDDISSFLKRFDEKDALEFFHSLGILTTEKNGKIYPKSLQSSSVCDILRFKLEELGTTIKCGEKVEKIVKCQDFFTVTTGISSFKSRNVVIATGGFAAPQFLTDGSGINFLKPLGHSLSKPLPALVHLTTNSPFMGMMKGLKWTAKGQLFSGGEMVREDTSEIHFGSQLSGPLSFNLSPNAVISLSGGNKTVLMVDFLFDLTLEKLVEVLTKKARIMVKTADLAFCGILPNQISKVIAKSLSLENVPMEKLSTRDIENLAKRAKDFPFEITGSLGFKMAQASLGGIPLCEFNENLESKFCKGLFATGEILNVTGDCGGFNLQWAWTSGSIVGNALSKKSD